MATAPKTASDQATAIIMQRAVFAACELGNFPLNRVDVQCAYDDFFRDSEFVSPPDYVASLQVSVLANLEKLGFTF